LTRRRFAEIGAVALATIAMLFRKRATQVEITLDLIESHGLTTEEYEQIRKRLGREPNLTELGIFSVMWSEHCSYKSSRLHLKKLPTQGPQVLQAL
jgi:phosphoribosylformylglycinamidine synthase